MTILDYLHPGLDLPAYTGPYKVGTTDVEIPAEDVEASSSTRPGPTIGTVAFRCFYPCPESYTSPQPTRWIQHPQRNVVAAYARFLGAGSILAKIFSYLPQLLYYVDIPVLHNAPLLESPHKSRRWPVVVFSHGLGGSRNAYSHYCGSLASYGLIVVAAEHRDGSIPITYVKETETTPARSVFYKPISHTADKQVYVDRDEQLKVRLWEIRLIYEALLKIDGGQSLHAIPTAKFSTPPSEVDTSVQSVLAGFASSLEIHEPGSIAFAGHSFGASTVIQFIKSVFYHRHNSINTPLLKEPPSTSLFSQISPATPVILLDPWALPLKSHQNFPLGSQPMPAFAQCTSSTDQSPPSKRSPPLAILSEAFYKWKTNLSSIKEHLHNPYASDNLQHGVDQAEASCTAHIFYPLRSAHLSQSDFGVLFPRITKYLAKADEPERTLRLNVRATLEVLRRAGAQVAPTTDVDLELAEGNSASTESDDFVLVDADGEEEHPPLAESNGVPRGDWKILSKDEGLVRGWLSVNVDESEEESNRLVRTASRNSEPATAETGGIDEKKLAADELPTERAQVAGDRELKGSIVSG